MSAGSSTSGEEAEGFEVEAHSILALLGIGFNVLVYTPLLIYFAYLFYRLRSCLVISKRHVNLVLVIACISIGYYLLERNVSMAINGMLMPSRGLHVLLQYSHCYLWPIFQYGLYYVTIFRFWLMYYKTKFAAAQMNDQWESIIDPELHDENWWIANKKRYGSGRYLRRYLVALWALIVVCEGTAWLLSYLLPRVRALEALAIAIDVAVSIFPLVLLIYVRQTLPVISDKLAIRQEILYLFLTAVFSFVIAAVLLVIAVIVFTIVVKNTNVDIYASARLGIAIVSTFGTFVIFSVQTVWVVHKFRAYVHIYSSRALLKTSLTQQILLVRKEKIENKNKICINDVLTHTGAFSVFMHHLIEEHSSECLLSLLEMSQFKDLLLSDLILLDLAKQQSERRETERLAAESTLNNNGSAFPETQSIERPSFGDDNHNKKKKRKHSGQSSKSISFGFRRRSSDTAHKNNHNNNRDKDSRKPSLPTIGDNSPQGGEYNNNNNNNNKTFIGAATADANHTQRKGHPHHDTYDNFDLEVYSSMRSVDLNAFTNEKTAATKTPSPPPAEAQTLNHGQARKSPAMKTTQSVPSESSYAPIQAVLADKSNVDEEEEELVFIDDNDDDENEDSVNIVFEDNDNEDESTVGVGAGLHLSMLPVSEDGSEATTTTLPLKNKSDTKGLHVEMVAMKPPLHLSASNNSSVNIYDIINVKTPRSRIATVQDMSLNSSAAIIAEQQNLMKFPDRLPRSAIVYAATIDLERNIPGTQVAPQEMGKTVHAETVASSSNIAHARSRSMKQTTVWRQKSKASSSSSSATTPRKQSRSNLQKDRQELIDSGMRTELEMVEEYKIRAYGLYYKYVMVGAEYEINIDYGTRNLISHACNDINVLLLNPDMDLETLLTLFDNCIHQMYQFCKHSMVRFKDSDGFEALIRVFTLDVELERNEANANGEQDGELPRSGPSVSFKFNHGI